MKRKVIIWIFLLGVLLLIVGVIFSFFPSSDSDKSTSNLKLQDIQTEKVTKDEITEYMELLYSDQLTFEKIKKFTGSDVSSSMLFFGKDSYLREAPSKEIINKYKLSKYFTKQDFYVSNVEKLMRENLEYQLGDYIVSAEGNIVQKFSFRTYYYQLYLNDLNEVMNKLLPSVFENYEEILVRDFTDEELAKFYQLKVKSLEIMNDYINNYVNESEVLSFDLIYKKEKEVIVQDYFSLLMQLGGSFYQNVSFVTSEDEQALITERNSRVQTMIDTAVANQTLDINNPLKLKD